MTRASVGSRTWEQVEEILQDMNEDANARAKATWEAYNKDPMQAYLCTILQAAICCEVVCRDLPDAALRDAFREQGQWMLAQIGSQLSQGVPDEANDN